MELNYKRLTVKSSDQTLTAAYADIGSELLVAGYSTLNLYITLDVNDSQNVTFQVLGKLDGSATAEYCLPQSVSTTAKFTVDKAVYELNFDADCYQVISIPLCGANYAQVQVKAGTLGVAAGIVNSVYAILI